MNLLDDDKIYLITYGEKVKYSSKRVIKVSHGVGNNSLVNYVLQDDLLDYYINYCHALFDDETKEWYIDATEKATNIHDASGTTKKR